MKGNRSPSKFSVKPNATDEEIWCKILDTLTSEENQEVDRLVSEIVEPYFGAKEITIRRSDKSIIAFASLSEMNQEDCEWAVYKEGI